MNSGGISGDKAKAGARKDAPREATAGLGQ